MKKILKCSDITSVMIHYENVRIYDSDHNEYYLSVKDLTNILKSINIAFGVISKRKRAWLYPLLSDIGYGEKLKEIMDMFEWKTIRETGVHGISGGFANVDFSGYDDQYFYFTLKWGIQNDVENTSHTEEWKLDRKFLILNNIEDIVAEIYECN